MKKLILGLAILTTFVSCQSEKKEIKKEVKKEEKKSEKKGESKKK